MQDHEKNVLMLIAVGAFIGVGKLLVSDEAISVRLVIGRAILGSAATVMAGIALLQVPDISPLALLGIGSALGIAGAQLIEMWIKRKAEKYIGDAGR